MINFKFKGRHVKEPDGVDITVNHAKELNWQPLIPDGVPLDPCHCCGKGMDRTKPFAVFTNVPRGKPMPHICLDCIANSAFKESVPAKL